MQKKKDQQHVLKSFFMYKFFILTDMAPRRKTFKFMLYFFLVDEYHTR